MIGLELFIAQLREEVDSRGFSIHRFAQMLNRRYPDNMIARDTLYRIFNRVNKKPQRRHLWMLCDWLRSLDVVAPDAREFAENYLEGVLKHGKKSVGQKT